MRSLFIGLVITAVAALWPSWVVADSNGERAVARRIAGNLKNSGLMENYRVGVKVRGRTAWLLGTIASSEQEETAIEIAEMTSGVNYVVSKLSISGGDRPGGVRQPQGLAAPRRLSQATHVTQADRPLSHHAEVAEAIPPLPHGARQNAPLPYATLAGGMQAPGGSPLPAYGAATSGVAPARYDQPNMPGYSWPSYAAYPNYAGLTYPRQYSPTAWPFIGPFYPYPQVPLGWRKVSLEWDDGWWQLDFKK